MNPLILSSLAGLAAIQMLPAAGLQGETQGGPDTSVPPSAHSPVGEPTLAPGPLAPPDTPAQGEQDPGPTSWESWWRFNREPYLELRSAIRASGITTDESWWPRAGQKKKPWESLRPSQQVIREEVVPALVHALETERSHDLLTRALIALARIGDVAAEDGSSEPLRIIRKLLKHRDQQVSETAAIALGILANDESTSFLTQLATDHPTARSYLGRAEVPYRTRAFAAYGLGLLGDRTSDDELRQDIAETLVDLLTTAHFSTRDVKVAAMTAFGLTAVDSDPRAVVEEGAAESNRRHVLSREAQLEFLLDYFDPAAAREHESTRHWLVRAHAPTAIARLLQGVRGQLRDRAARVLLNSLDAESEVRREIQMSCTLALGEIGDASSEGARDIDVEIRSALTRSIRLGEPQVRRFALIALAQCAGTPGPGRQAVAGTAAVRKTLQASLARGPARLRPWAGLAVGVLARRLKDNGQAVDDGALRALMAEAQRCKRPDDIGAYLLGLGIAGYGEAREVCLDKLAYFDAASGARGYAALALGLMQDRSAIEPIQELIRTSENEPDFLQPASIALSLLSHKEFVPDLLEMLAQDENLATQAAVATALGTFGDRRSIEPLLEMLASSRHTDRTRGFAALALGSVCDEESLPWSVKISIGVNYRAGTGTLIGSGEAGILDIL
ncbi:MAG: HEAT repeat domain-containing protein [Planctomycetota bacterium]